MRTLATQYTTTLIIILPHILERDTAVLYHIYAVTKPKVNSGYFHAAMVIRNE